MRKEPTRRLKRAHHDATSGRHLGQARRQAAEEAGHAFGREHAAERVEQRARRDAGVPVLVLGLQTRFDEVKGMRRDSSDAPARRSDRERHAKLVPERRRRTLTKACPCEEHLAALVSGEVDRRKWDVPPQRRRQTAPQHAKAVLLHFAAQRLDHRLERRGPMRRLQSCAQELQRRDERRRDRTRTCTTHERGHQQRNTRLRHRHRVLERIVVLTGHVTGKVWHGRRARQGLAPVRHGRLDRQDRLAENIVERHVGHLRRNGHRQRRQQATPQTPPAFHTHHLGHAVPHTRQTPLAHHDLRLAQLCHTALVWIYTHGGCLHGQGHRKRRRRSEPPQRSGDLH